MSTKYKEYKQLNLPETADSVLDFWQKNDIFKKSVSGRDGRESFVFYEGPPSANGMPGIHHVMARTIKDIFCRYKTLKGFQVDRKGGWDTHGLPVELQVEKQAGITKEDIGTKVSVEEYNRMCRETVMKYKGVWDDLTTKMGYWVDLDNPYVTFENNYIESCWSLLKKLYEKDLLYKGYTIQPYSPAAGTGLSSHELNQPGCYRDVKDTSAIAQFKVKGTANDFFLAWTTTPWTLPSNTALAVGKDIDYVKIKTHNQYTDEPINVILAKALVSSVFAGKYVAQAQFDEAKDNQNKIPYTIIEECKGAKLDGMQYEQLMPYLQPLQDADKAFRVIIGDFVSTEDGTGIVHIAPTFGADDFRVAQQNGVPALTVLDAEGNEMPLVDKQGRFIPEVGEFGGLYVKEEYFTDEERAAEGFKPTDVLIAIKLKEENKAFKVEKYEHSYPHCWRTDKPVLYYPLDSWFIRTTSLKDRLVELNKTINWKPKSTGEGRFGNWLENLVDWNLSRSRFWGTPLPIWRSEDGKEELCIGSVAELRSELDKSVKAGLMKENPLAEGKEFDLHRPYADRFTLVSPSGKAMHRETDLIDVWFDSGAMPYAQWHYPFENQEVWKNNFPADFISEGVDQTRGWFFTLHAIGVLAFDSIAFKNVVSTGLVLDEKGEKMSKSKGNVIDPFEAMKEYGIDALRWYMIANASPWDNLKFSLKGVEEIKRRFFGTLHNTFNFFALYANLDDFEYGENLIPVAKRTESDRWIISRLNTLIKTVDEAFADYEPTKAARAIQDFTADDLSNWYVRLNRKRFWKGELSEDKRAAYQTLYECLKTLSQLISPISPFYADQLFKDLRGAEESVHLSDMPVASEELIDADLEQKMQLAQTISSLVHSLRKAKKIKVRQPLQKIMVPAENETIKAQIEAVSDLIKAEVNVKEVTFIEAGSGILVKQIKPNFRKLGQVYKNQMKAVAALITDMSQDEIAVLESKGEFVLTLDNEPITITSEDAEISTQDIPGLLVATENRLTVALDITLTDELIREGIAREVVKRIQNMRKDRGMEVQDRIKIRIGEQNEMVGAALTEHKEYICTETQANSLDQNGTSGEAVETEDFTLLLDIELVS